jgi:orotate phosphoribosyltransferase
MSLFNRGDFTLHSGARSNFLIDCAVLGDEDWSALAEQLAARLPRFSRVVGIPRGGLALARAMRAHATRGANRTLVVDDVVSTGGSMYAAIAKERKQGREATGAAIFARAEVPATLHVVPLFWMEPL